MPHRHGLRTVLLGSALLASIGACDKDKLSGPAAEVHKSTVDLKLPAVPAFDLPAAPADGSHTVKELRVKGQKLLDTDVTVKGIVTWAYDCPTAIRTPGMTDKELQTLLDEHPENCERPKFYIGDAASTPPEKSLWIVDVPRPYNKLELERNPKEELKNPPPDRCNPKNDPKKSVCGPYKVGDEVEITGSFKLSSPHSERNSDGLLVYKKMKNITQNWETPVLDPPPGTPAAGGAAAGGPPPPGAKPSPEDLTRKKG
ncbi:MAG TPA: hypothetical protein VGM88_24630 [Kofleriaceae bacterium]